MPILIAVGDISLRAKCEGSPFRMVKKEFNHKDILFGNLETVLSNCGKKAEKSVLLYTDPRELVHLKDAGFDIFNLANNHIMDLGLNGFNETLNLLHENDIAFIGVKNAKFTQSHVVLEREEIRFGFIGYSESAAGQPGRGCQINKISKTNILNDIITLRRHCDVVIVSLHWGVEGAVYPSPEEIELARSLIDSGGTVVLGHHPHVVRGIEKYKHGLIAYSLGNFQFDLSVSRLPREETAKSIILVLQFKKADLESYSVIPIKINSQYVPFVVNGEEREEFLRHISVITTPIEQERITKSWWFEQIADIYLSENVKSWVIRIKLYGFIHTLKFIKWLVSPFTIRCYMGLLMRKLKYLVAEKA